jgi:hypothetical protein
MGKYDYLLHSAKYMKEPMKPAPDAPQCLKGTCRWQVAHYGYLKCRRCGFIKRSDRS